MITITKIFHFEMGHALHGYNGLCQYVHGHSYELHVTVKASHPTAGYIAPPGFLIDFKELKEVVKTKIIDQMDHRLWLSKDYLAANPGLSNQKNLVVCAMEPSAENLLTHIQQILTKEFPGHIRLAELKLYETKDSFAQWVN